MTTILDTIVATKHREIDAARALIPESVLANKISEMPPTRGFNNAIRKSNGLAIIAEVKKASPSAGVIRSDFDPVKIAEIYSANGASCISVLTDVEYFQGSPEYLKQISEVNPCPTLRKDFVVDRYQLLEARAWGAAAALLIAEILPGTQLQQLYDFARRIGLDVLIEFHDADQLQRVLDTGTELLGINNRDLRTFETSMNRTFSQLAAIPSHVMVVSESGIKTHDDVKALEQAGVKAILVGESLMKEQDIGLALRRLRGKVVT